MYVAGHGVDSNDYMKGDFSMTKMKKICIPVLAAAALAFSVPGTTQEAEASCNTYRVNVVTDILLFGQIPPIIVVMRSENFTVVIWWRYWIILAPLVTGMYTLLSMTISDM